MFFVDQKPPIVPPTRRFTMKKMTLLLATLLFCLPLMAKIYL